MTKELQDSFLLSCKRSYMVVSLLCYRMHFPVSPSPFSSSFRVPVLISPCTRSYSHTTHAPSFHLIYSTTRPLFPFRLSHRHISTTTPYAGILFLFLEFGFWSRDSIAASSSTPRHTTSHHAPISVPTSHCSIFCTTIITTPATPPGVARCSSLVPM